VRYLSRTLPIFKGNKMKNYIIGTTTDYVEFKGKYSRILQTKNWHYYEKEDGTVIRFRKEHMVSVEEKEITE